MCACTRSFTSRGRSIGGWIETGIWIRELTCGWKSTHGEFSRCLQEEQRQAESLTGYAGDVGRKGVRTRGDCPNFRRGHRSAAIFRRCWLLRKANSGKLTRFTTDRHASRNPTCFLSALARARARSLLSSLGQSFSSSSSALAFLRGSLHSFRTTVIPPAIHPLGPTFTTSFSRPFQTLRILQGGDTRRIVKVSSSRCISGEPPSSCDRLRFGCSMGMSVSATATGYC